MARATRILDKAAGAGVSALLRGIRCLNRQWISNVAAAVMRTVGPLLREQRIGRDNLKAAFPDKSPQEIERILRGVWDNLGRVAAEFAHLDRICAGDPERRIHIDYAPGTAARFKALRDDGKPALVFA